MPNAQPRSAVNNCAAGRRRGCPQCGRVPGHGYAYVSSAMISLDRLVPFFTASVVLTASPIQSIQLGIVVLFSIVWLILTPAANADPFCSGSTLVNTGPSCWHVSTQRHHRENRQCQMRISQPLRPFMRQDSIVRVFHRFHGGWTDEAYGPIGQPWVRLGIALWLLVPA